jgi:5S rRNA maturation endonuclease (ribonuclease M5)
MNFEQVLSRFPDAKKVGPGWMAKCPAHADRSPSLSISRGGAGRTLLKCHAGCAPEKIVATVGLKMSDLFVDNGVAIKPNGSERRIVATYDFRDRNGKLLFQVVRYDPKDFRQRRPDGKGDWIWNLEGVDRVLFQLPETLAAVSEDRPIYIAEGERDVVALKKAGFAATCNSGGAGKWLESYNKTLRDADVVVIADKDEAGRRHAQLVAQNLHGIAKSVRVIELPNTNGKSVKDADDFFDAGGDPADLDELAQSAPIWIPQVGQAENDAIPPAPRASASLEIIILPSGEISISESARVIFEKFKPRQTLFNRGGVVTELVEVDGIQSLRVLDPEKFRSDVEKLGPLFAYRAAGRGEPALKPAKMSLGDSKAILASSEAREILPPVASVLRSPVLIETSTGSVAVLGKGYHPVLGGLLVLAGDTPPQVPIFEAVEALRWLLEEFDFPNESDRSRALAALLTPALRLGGFLRGNIPIDCAEADQSQAGKGYRHNLVCALYNETSYLVTAKSGGVGSVDESFAAALVSGRPFICLDNFRGRMDSQNLEAFMTSPGVFPARIPHCAEVLIDPKHFLLQLSSNGLEATRDLANRASICRIRKRPGFHYRDTLRELKRRQPYFLGCVFTVIREWVAKGKPRSSDTRHDFREWSQVLDWIVVNILGCAPLMDEHEAAQERTSNPALSFLRSVALGVEAENRLGTALIASELVEICELRAIKIPGEPDEEGKAKRQIGCLCKQVFRDSNIVNLDGFNITRGQQAYRKPSGDMDTTNAYTFTK